MGDDLDILDENKHINSDLNVTVTKIETPTLRSECWKQAIINYFGPAKTCLLKKGSVIKVVFESEKNNNSTVKINFYKTGSIVIQGQKCTQFSDSYFEVIKGKVYQNNNNETSVPNLNSTSIKDNAEETIPKDLNDSQDKVLDNLHDEDDVTVASTPIKQSVVETKLTPKNRILQHSKTIETKFSEINSILSVINQTMKSFVEKLAQLYNIQEKVPQNIQSVITNSLNTQKNEMMSQWKSIDDKVKHCNGSLDSLHIKTNDLDTQRTRIYNDNECPSIQNDISRVENTPISDTNNTSTKLSQVSKTKCDVLILGDSILRRIQPKRFTPQGKTVVRFIRGGAKTCTSFVKKNGQQFEPKNILIHIGTRDLQGEGVHEDGFSQLLDQCTKTLNNSSIYVLPIISRKDIHDDIVNEANNTIELVCNLYPSIHKIERFDQGYDMFHDDVHLNYGKGIPAIVKHLNLIAQNIPYTNNTQQQRNRRQGENNFSRSTHQLYYRRDGLNVTNHNTNMNSHQGVNPLHGFNHHYPPSFNQQHMMPWFLPTNHSMNNPNFNNWRNPWSFPPFGQIHFPPPDQQQAQIEVEKYSSMGDIIIQGDFNAYTNTQLDFIEFDNVTEHVNLDDSEYHPDRTLSRNNLDHKHTNNSGKLLLNMCKETKIRILNGRTTGDLNGQPTCITYNGNSLVDYTLTSEELIDSIGYFVVQDFTSLSNHCPISCAMFANFSSVPCDLHKLDSLPGKFLWTDEAIASYTENMQGQMFKDKFANFIAKSFNDSDSITDSFNSILVDCAKQSAKFINKKPIQKLRKSTRKPWSENTLVSKSFLATEKNNPWTKKLYSILNNLGFSNLAGGNFSTKQYLPSIKQRVIDQCMQDQSSKIYNSSKLKFYQQFHNSNQCSSYVDVLSNKLERSSLCKIRLSAYNLAIEKG
ncbi:unnamed protein product [Mytilus coruscus]|uniref:Endonuclease/exonuclease/phosphatase domain-containing protein n=1 Tax=Mytilus coruscus TaxID=42192 RepID=A0A6J8B526_MYTCO|nr:unnamed protein product [Mytilus coruscus]